MTMKIKLLTKTIKEQDSYRFEYQLTGEMPDWANCWSNLVIQAMARDYYGGEKFIPSADGKFRSQDFAYDQELLEAIATDDDVDMFFWLRDPCREWGIANAAGMRDQIEYNKTLPIPREGRIQGRTRPVYEYAQFQKIKRPNKTYERNCFELKGVQGSTSSMKVTDRGESLFFHVASLKDWTKSESSNHCTGYKIGFEITREGLSAMYLEDIQDLTQQVLVACKGSSQWEEKPLYWEAALGRPVLKSCCDSMLANVFGFRLGGSKSARSNENIHTIAERLATLGCSVQRFKFHIQDRDD
jgi:hypothetical protein